MTSQTKWQLKRLYIKCKKFKIKYFLTGHNDSTEGWMPLNVSHYKMDTINFKHIHFKFGKENLKQYPIIGPLKKLLFKKFVKYKPYIRLIILNIKKKKQKKF